MGTGCVEVTLHLPGGENFTLQVVEPDGGPTIWSGTRTSPSGGQWEAVSERGPERGVAETQNIHWPTGSAPSGEYGVVILAGQGCGQPEAEVRLDVRVGGEVVSSETLPVPYDFAGAHGPPCCAHQRYATAGAAM
jgi:hypothetical protein